MAQETSPKLRIDFIGMLFALAVGQVAIEIGDFFSHGSKIADHLYVLSHLALTIFIIASSWIGWQTSTSKGSEEALNDSFSLSFLVLLIDLFLVICYFVIVKGVEKPLDNVLTDSPESKTEIFWSEVIFMTYFIWDIITKFIVIVDHKNIKFKLDLTTFLKRGYQSLLCFFIVYLLFTPMGNMSTKMSVIVTDIGLFCTFALFRGLKSERILMSPKKSAIGIRLVIYIVLPVAGLIATLFLNYMIHV